MRLHYLQHVPFEDAANIAVWAAERGDQVNRTLLYEGEPLPEFAAVDWLAVMGGPMGVHDEDAHPWLAGEKQFLRRAIEARIPILGICLGAQLIAEALGGAVTKGPHREIGWYPVTLTSEALGEPLLDGFPERLTAFHWHGDTFSLPPGAVHLARSEACENQAFLYGDRVLGLQFHLDYHVEAIGRMIACCPDALTAGPFVQADREALCDPHRVENTKRLLYRLLAAMERRFPPKR
jgi:GMP synthase (glutamine-hydrolysing)